MRASHGLLGLVTVAALAASARDAQAAAPWVDRKLTLPASDWAFDFGLGIAHVPAPETGVGANAEMAVGLTDRVELGLRTGLRFGDPAERGTHADQYGRLFDRQYFGGGDDVLANPELRVRGGLVRGEVFELGLEGRLIVPIELGTDAGLLFGVPLAFHLGDRVRLDTGGYVPVHLGNGGYASLSVPLDVWIQASPRLWLGPMTGVVFNRLGDARASNTVSIGFGLGYAITHYLDFKTMFLFPDISDDTRVFGLGAGIQIRIE